MLEQPLRDLDAWCRHLVQAELPVMQDSIDEIALLAEAEEARGNVDAHTLAQAIGGDPLMTLRVLVHVSRLCTRKGAEPPETLTGALVMLGIAPFFRAFADLQGLQTHLTEHPEALEGLQRTLMRARRAAHHAYHWALHRQDEDAEIIYQATLLHDVAELMMWCHAPRLMLQVERQLAADHTLRSGDVQQAMLNVNLSDLSQALMRQWHLPGLLIEVTDDRHAEHPRVRTVMLAMRLARHTQYGWLTPNAQAALPDDIQDIARLLNLSNQAALRKVQDTDLSLGLAHGGETSAQGDG
ncbi:HDOD domain-containing protein [Aquabacterium lacunae]|uniref:HDOD domain-containing protein n=1 Tax=Aquabacterium lacunae TaxID=2528630 RepID=A0A4Q9GZP6_9BURK|nr:HDOD domain-containing protein [Aquabacterium lacunae]TBO32493.1 HDOD domain-containing protein [Aquabacterium lacunae]